MKLSKTQQKVAGLMKEGWRLTSLIGISPQGFIDNMSLLNMGEGKYKDLKVSMATIRALLDKGIIKSTEQFPTKKYELIKK